MTLLRKTELAFHYTGDSWLGLFAGACGHQGSCYLLAARAFRVLCDSCRACTEPCRPGAGVATLLDNSEEQPRAAAVRVERGPGSFRCIPAASTTPTSCSSTAAGEGPRMKGWWGARDQGEAFHLKSRRHRGCCRWWPVTVTIADITRLGLGYYNKLLGSA